MGVKTKCPQCLNSHEIPADYVGKNIKCPFCKTEHNSNSQDDILYQKKKEAYEQKKAEEEKRKIAEERIKQERLPDNWGMGGFSLLATLVSILAIIGGANNKDEAIILTGCACLLLSALLNGTTKIIDAVNANTMELRRQKNISK